jgi:membrane-associated PAP2 superfamily phosphatase
VYPVGHVFVTIVELVDVAQLEESPGMGKYPAGHVAAGFIYLELRFVF